MTKFNYPLRFKTIFKEKIWGGNKINTVLGKDYAPLANCGETWELSAVPGNVSVVENGVLKGEDLKTLCTSFAEELMGKSVAKTYGTEFPLLIKYIDAAADLSVQVHPNDEVALQKHGCKGKTEMWYIMQADKDATLNSGFAKQTNKVEYAKAIEEGRSLDYLHFEKVQAGDVFYMPAGRIHYIGKGVMLAEIQQTSDITYRIYDFDRVDDQGNKRELHIKDGVEALDFEVLPTYKTTYVADANKSTPVVKSAFFNTNIVDLKAGSSCALDFKQRDSFTILICVEGEGAVSGDFTAESLKPGDVLLIPSSLPKVLLNTINGTKVLEVHL
jgi:mannose-6-phosphate isomerase